MEDLILYCKRVMKLTSLETERMYLVRIESLFLLHSLVTTLRLNKSFRLPVIKTVWIEDFLNLRLTGTVLLKKPYSKVYF